MRDSLAQDHASFFPTHLSNIVSDQMHGNKQLKHVNLFKNNLLNHGLLHLILFIEKP